MSDDPIHDPGRLTAVRSTGLLDTPPEESFDRLTQLAAKLTGAPVTFLSLVDSDRDFYKSCFGFPEPLASDRQLTGTTFCHFAIVSDAPLVIDNTLEHPIYRDVPTVKSLGVQAYLGVPLRTAAGHALGSFCAIDFKPRHWTPLDIEVMTELAASTLREIELRATLAALSAERHLLDATMRQMPAGVVVCDTEGRILMNNGQARAILGREATDLQSESEGQSYRKDGSAYRRQEWPLLRAITAGETVSHEEIVYQHDDGRRRFLSVSASPVRDDDGRIIGGVATIDDVTEHQRLLAALDEERGRLATLLEHVPAGILFAEAPSGRLTISNRQVEEILGHPPYSTPDLDAYAQWIGFHPDGRLIQPHEWPIARAVQGEVVRAEELLYQRGDGRKTWIRVHAAPVRDSAGAILGGIAALYDIDDQRRMTMENARLYDEAQRANQAKEQFFAAISHELRTPMTSIIGWARVLLMEELDNATAIEAAEMIESSAKLQAQLVDDLLDLSRISTGKIALHRQSIDLNEVIEQALRAARPAAESKGVRLRTTFGSVRTMDADRDRLRQIIGNLLSNSVKFTPAGGLIEIESREEAGVAVISVCDTGRGITAELLPLIFERGRQASNAELGGLGLGLTIVRHLVELHGGEISAASDGPGRGATFTVRLPLPAQPPRIARLRVGLAAPGHEIENA